MTWWKSSVVYQIYPRSFNDSNGDGIGDVRGILDRLDHLSELGVDVIWLSPVYRSPQDDNGYDISDYTDIDPLFGTLADLDELIAALHERGMKLVMDLVVNHTSDEHPWFVESRDPGSDKRDWYFWRPARPGFVPGSKGAEPTNWSSLFSGPAWEYDPDSGEYYLHVFSRKQPDLNWENPSVRQAVYAMMNWWVERGVDGFRMDVINLISKTLPFADGDPNSLDGLSYDLGVVVNGPRLEEFLQEMNAAVGISAKQLFTVGEMLMVDVQHARRYTSAQADELGMVFTFEHMSLDQQPGFSKFDLRPLRLPELKANLAVWQNGLADDGWNSLYWNNHDQPRVVSRFGDDSQTYRVTSAKTLGTVLHLLRGTPYVYQGEEIGMTNAGYTAIEQYADIESLNYYAAATGAGADPAQVLQGLAVKSRDNARTPVQWDDSANAGFSTARPWLPVNANSDSVNAASARADADSVFHHYRALIALRHEYEIVREGRFALLLPEHDQVFAYTRTWGEQVLLVLANWSSTVVCLDGLQLPERTGAELLLGTHEPGEAGLLRPWESTVQLLR